MAKSPTRAPKKTPPPARARLEKLMKHNNESDFKSVKIKKEVLDSVRTRNKQPLKSITPDEKRRVRRSKTEKSFPSSVREPDKGDIPMMEKTSKPKPALVNKENVLQYLNDTPSELLLKMEVNQMHTIIQAWKKHRGLAEIQDIRTVSEAFLLIELEDIKNEAIREQQSNQLAIHLEMEVDEELATAKNVHIDNTSTIKDIQQYDKDELAYYLHHHSKNEEINVNQILALDHSVVVGMVDKFLHPLQQDTKTNQEVDMGSVKPITASKETEDIQMEKKDSSFLTLPSALRSLKSNPVYVQKEKFEITSKLSDETIKSASLKQMQHAFHSFCIQSGEEIPTSAINEWTHPFLTEICTAKRDNLRIQERMLVSMKSKPSNPFSTKSTKAKKRQTNLINPNRTKNSCRYSLHFTIPAQYKGTNGLREFLSLIFNEMKKYGEGLCLLPWSTDAFTNQISTADEIPTTITSISKYFEGARSPESSIQLYLKIRLGYLVEMKKDNFDADVQGWCKAQSIRMYQCSVQHPNVKSCGWLVYAPRSLNQQKWCQKVTQIYEAKYGTKNSEPFQLGLTWRALNGQWDVDRKSKVRAMHIDAPVEIAPRVKNFLRVLAQHKRWPLNVRFRVMDEFSRYMKESTKQKYRYMVSKHTSLLNQLGMCECTQILNLDKRIGNSQMTLRDVILNVRDNKDGYRVFGSIDEKWNSDTIFVATYRPDKSSLAYDFVRSLSTYVTYLYPDVSLKRILTPYSIDKAKDEQYNPNLQTFTTQEDTDLDREIQADLDDDSMNFATPDDINDPFHFDETIRLVGGDSVWDLNGDDDTVSTNQPQGMGNVSFNSAVCRLYDTNSCASSVNSNSSQQKKQTSTISETIAEEINNLAAPLPNAIKVNDSKDEAADHQ